MVLNCSALCQIPFCIMQRYMYVFISCYHLKKCECKSWYFRFVTLSFPSSTRRLLYTPAKTQTWLLFEIQITTFVSFVFVVASNEFWADIKKYV